MKCNRTRCPHELTRYCMLIWNEPSTGIPRVYCVGCGRKITQKHDWDNSTLLYEVVAVADAEFRFPQLFAKVKNE